MNHVPAEAGPPDPRLSSLGERERKAVIARRVGGGSICCSFCSISNSLSHTTLSIKWEVYFSKERCPLVFIVLTMFPCIVAYVLCGYTTNLFIIYTCYSVAYYQISFWYNWFLWHYFMLILIEIRFLSWSFFLLAMFVTRKNHPNLSLFGNYYNYNYYCCWCSCFSSSLSNFEFHGHFMIWNEVTLSAVLIKG